MADFARAAFPPFFMQSPSSLTHQRHLETGHGRSNCETLFGMCKVPGDSQVRAMLDPIGPALFYPMFADIVAELDQCGGLDAMRVLDGHVLVAWTAPSIIGPTIGEFRAGIKLDEVKSERSGAASSGRPTGTNGCAMCRRAATQRR